MVADPGYLNERERLRDLMQATWLPSALRDHVVAGGLISYSYDLAASFRYAAKYVDKILKGAKPADSIAVPKARGLPFAWIPPASGTDRPVSGAATVRSGSDPSRWRLSRCGPRVGSRRGNWDRPAERSRPGSPTSRASSPDRWCCAPQSRADLQPTSLRPAARGTGPGSSAAIHPCVARGAARRRSTAPGRPR